jgi:hypothetical protein
MYTWFTDRLFVCCVRRTYGELSAKGVTLLSEQAERPYSIEAMMRDDSGNLMSLTQPHAFDPSALDPSPGG